MSNYNTQLQLNNTDLQSILDTINNLPEAGSGGVDLPELTNEGSASDLLSGKELIDQDGNVVTGSMVHNGSVSQTMDGVNTKSISIPSGYTSGGTVALDNTIDSEVITQADLITQIKNTANSLPDVGEGNNSGNAFPYSITATNNMGVSHSTFYDYENNNVIIFFQTQLVYRTSSIVGNGQIRGTAQGLTGCFFYIADITGDITLNVTFENPYEV